MCNLTDILNKKDKYLLEIATHNKMVDVQGLNSKDLDTLSTKFDNKSAKENASSPAVMSFLIFSP